MRFTTVNFLGLTWTAHYEYEPAQHGGRDEPSYPETYTLGKLERPGTIIEAGDLREQDRMDLECEIAEADVPPCMDPMFRNGWATV